MLDPDDPQLATSRGETIPADSLHAGGNARSGRRVRSWRTRSQHRPLHLREHHRAQQQPVSGCGETTESGAGIGCDVPGNERVTLRTKCAVDTGSKVTEEEGMSSKVKFVKGDFMNMPFSEQAFDAAYQIEATCHAADRVGCYRQIFRVLKPGAVFTGYEWCLTDKFDAKNPVHVNLKHGIEIGDGLPDILSTHRILACLREAGFEVEESKDLAPTGQIPWYQPFFVREAKKRGTSEQETRESKRRNTGTCALELSRPLTHTGHVDDEGPANLASRHLAHAPHRLRARVLPHRPCRHHEGPHQSLDSRANPRRVRETRDLHADVLLQGPQAPGIE